ncbi:tRNA (adenosine(37)-N6)-dimethylallyltransferase MiaA [Patescibacteria group bacterium]
MSTMKYHIITYGCGANHADSERIEAKLHALGHTKAANKKVANLIVINSCSVRKSAMDRLYAQINKLKTKKKKVILAGCILEKDLKNLKDKVSEVWHPDEYFDLMPIYADEVGVSVPIMTGCNNFCTYCAVPYTRGREKSRPAKDIVDEIKKLVASPAGRDKKEIWLLGQNVNSYRSGKTNFPKLLQKIDKIPGKFWVRFISPHPKDFSIELIKTIKKCEKITEYINVPVQSGDNEILKRMNRNYTREHYIKLVNRIRKEIPDASISTDTIVGFPGETKKQFLNTKDLYKKLKFDMAFLAEYSPRPGTFSAMMMKDNVSHTEKEKRKKELNDILTKTALENNKKYIGKTVEVLNGRTRTNKLVTLHDTEYRVGPSEFLNVKITGAESWRLKGEIVKKIVVVLGPTASGKSGLAVEIAQKFPSEIISADSRQIYKGMNIGSGKITKKEMKGIKHHLLNIVSPRKIYSAGEFKKEAQKCIEGILKQDKTPIICGGTGFYINSLLGGNIAEVEPDWNLRKKLEEKTTKQLFGQLKKLKPQRAKNIDSQNKRRLIRAIEIAKSASKSDFDAISKSDFDVLYLGIKKDGEKLKKIIDKRVDEMIEEGLEKEVKKLVKKYGWTKTLKNTIGYQEWKEDNSEEKIKAHSHQYAKRQITWFKKYAPKTHWLGNKKEALKLVRNFLKN